MHQNSTLMSSTLTHYLWCYLQALPHSPEEEAWKPQCGKVEHFVPVICIPDAKTESCMRCRRSFGWQRRRHHCRLGGWCICANRLGKVSCHFYFLILYWVWYHYPLDFLRRHCSSTSLCLWLLSRWQLQLHGRMWLAMARGNSFLWCLVVDHMGKGLVRCSMGLEMTLGRRSCRVE